MIIDGEPYWMEGFLAFHRTTDDQCVIFTDWQTFTPAQIAARNVAIKKAWACPILRARHSARLQQPETKAKLRAAKLAHWVKKKAQQCPA